MWSPWKKFRVSADPLTTTELEFALLRALCTGSRSHAACAKLASELKDYPWQNADNRVIYEALIEIGNLDAETLRWQLPAATARMGFPDIDWQRYFVPSPVHIDRLNDLIRDLKSRATL
jgi:hypothetical protein